MEKCEPAHDYCDAHHCPLVTCFRRLQRELEILRPVALECRAYVEAEIERGRMTGIDCLFDDMVKALGAAKANGSEVLS